MSSLGADTWRTKEGFSPDIETANRRLFQQGLADGDVAAILRDWLKKNQPCLFGRMAAAQQNRISFCILRDHDLVGTDAEIKDKIQRARLQWKRDAYRSRKSAFVVAAISPSLAAAAPNQPLMALAQRIAKLYLLREVEPDQIYLDTIPLEFAGPEGVEHWEWDVGTNFFGVQGDKRWWHDHRIPGGIAFSMNSVGHLVRTGREGLAGTLASHAPGPSTLGIALKMAMLTIQGAHEGVSGKATRLLGLEGWDAAEPVCPFPRDTFPQNLQSKDFRRYEGWYHTDVTIPREFFHESVTRPAEIAQPHSLDFTYLFHDEIDNVAHETMGKGVRFR